MSKGRFAGMSTTNSISTSGFTYNHAGQVTGFSYLNGISASFGYSADRLQLSSVAYTQSSTNLLSLSYNYDQDSGSGVKNNGQIAGISDNVQSGRSATYTYDARKRLATAGTSGSTGYPQWGLSWTYDDYGNRTAQSVTAGSGPSNSVSVSTSTNQITAMGGYTFYYDANGNLTQDDLYKYKYDAENRLVEVKNLSDTLIATYAFDGHSLRTIKVVGAGRTWYLHAGTELIAEFEDAASATYSTPTNPGGAGSDSGALFLYQHGDHLTGRLTTDQQGNVSNEQGHYPYGESWYATGTADPSVERKFTSYLKDAEVSTGRLNYAVFRQHSARVGRFLRPDPLLGRGPQNLNRYAYVGGDPISRRDSTGRDWDPAVIDTSVGRSGPDCDISPFDPKCPPPLMESAAGAPDDHTILFGGGNLGDSLINPPSIGSIGSVWIGPPGAGGGPAGWYDFLECSSRMEVVVSGLQCSRLGTFQTRMSLYNLFYGPPKVDGNITYSLLVQPPGVLQVVNVVPLLGHFLATIQYDGAQVDLIIKWRAEWTCNGRYRSHVEEVRIPCSLTGT